MGLYSYPVLMAADILLFDTQLVPVGKDQKQHLEIARDIAMRFNNTYGETFAVPEPDIEKETQLIPGTDGKKMSKSYNNTIPIFDSEKTIRKKIMKIITDKAGIDEPKEKESPLFQLYSLFLNHEGRLELSDRYDGKGVRYGDIKQELFQKVMDYFQPYREKRNKLVNNPKEVYEILKYGAKKAGLIANEDLARVKSSSGLRYDK
jgi:tryptophanyl-tRNA synthetase